MRLVYGRKGFKERIWKPPDHKERTSGVNMGESSLVEVAKEIKVGDGLICRVWEKSLLRAFFFLFTCFS